MSELKEFYVKKIGHDYNGIKNSLWYLSKLALRGAIEIDNFLLGRNHDFSHVQEFAEILEEYQLKDTDTAINEPNFPYLPLWMAVRKNSDKDIRKMQELALEMRLLRFELEDVPANSKKLKEFRSFLNDLSIEFSNEHQNYSSHRLVA